MAFDILGLAISFASVYGIYSILSISLNLEYGFGGQPNLGQVLFYGLGAFFSAILVANLLPILSHQAFSSICASSALIQRESIALANSSFALSSWILALIVSTIVGGIIGFFLAYPATRVKEEWFLAMILLVAGDMFVVIVNNTPQFGCGLNGVPGILTPFSWLALSIERSFPTINPAVPNYISTGLYALIIIALTVICYFIAEKLVKSPYGRLLKSIRDDPIAAESLGKDINKVRRQIMIIGSAMAGLAGGLYVFYIGVATTEDYVSAVTFSLWVIVILGGFANNKGVLVGALIVTGLDRGSIILGTLVQSYFPGFNADLIIYIKYMLEAVILLLLLVYRPKGIFPEKPVRTPAYDEFQSRDREMKETG